MSGSFWKFSNGFASVSNVSTLIENYQVNGDDDMKTNVLLKLLDEDDLLQELVSNNSALLEFLRDDDVLSILFDLVINEGVLDNDEIVNDVSKLDIAENEQQGDQGKSVNDDQNLTDHEASTDEVMMDDKEDKSDKDKPEDNDNDKHQQPDDDDDDEDDKDEDDDEREKDDSDDETDEEKHSRQATIATEILSADVWSLTDTVMESTTNLTKLWNILDTTEPLSITLSTYFMKIMEHLLDMKCDEMILYLIENQPKLVNKFINHLSNPPLMDFLLKLISTDKPDNSTGIIDFFQNQQLIPKLIDALDPNEKDCLTLVKQSSAADLLKALITISANSTTDNSTIGPNELTRELVSYEMMNKLCDIMLKGGYALSNGVGIIIEIIRKNNSDYDILPILYITLESHPPTGRDPIYLGYLLQVFSENISKFNDLLSSERQSKVTPSHLKTSLGEIEPLGFERFKVCELIAELLHCSNMALLNDNKGYDVVKERNELRNKMKEYDAISFKYNEVIILPEGTTNSSSSTNNTKHEEFDHDFNDTIDSFNSKNESDNEDSILHNQYEEEPHENANLSEEEIRARPVIGDLWKISLYDTQIINNILIMFFKFPWNNFLHNVVFDIVQQVLNGSMDIGFNKFLAIDLFDRGNITIKIIEGQKLCNDFEINNNGLRLGYMGHLTLIAEEVVKFIQSYPTNTLSEIIDIKVNEEIWEEYVSNILYDTREKYNAILGGGDEDDGDEDDDNVLNTFDESSGEVIEESDYKAGFLFDNDRDDNHPSNDQQHDSDEDERLEDEDDSEHKQEHGDDEKIISKNEEDDDHFSKYMSQELVNTGSEVPDKSSDEEISSDDDDIVVEEEYKKGEYIDPNDDGNSYKKFNRLYDDTGALISEKNEEIEDVSSLSDSDEEDLEEMDIEKTKLTRSSSKS